MEKHIGRTTIILAVLLMTSGCLSGGQLELELGSDGARTYFESLNLDTPEDAVQTFAQAFQREDFMTVYLVLDAKAQRQQRMDYARTYSWQHLIGESANESWINNVDLEQLFDVTIDSWYLFDQIMLYAVEEDDLLIDLRGDLHILRNEESMVRDGRQAMDVAANVDEVSGEVVFCMVADRDGRWRVYLVSAPGEGVDSWPSPLLNENP